MDISCEDAFLSTCEDGTQVEWVKVSLLGQSFLLNQVSRSEITIFPQSIFY